MQEGKQQSLLFQQYELEVNIHMSFNVNHSESVLAPENCLKIVDKTHIEAHLLKKTSYLVHRVISAVHSRKPAVTLGAARPGPVRHVETPVCTV